MIKKLFKTFFVLLYSAVLVGSAVAAWDFVNHWQDADGDYNIEQYAASVNERYGDQARDYSQTAIGIAQTSVASAKTLAETTGVADLINDALGEDAPTEDATLAADPAPLSETVTEADAAEENGEQPQDPLIVASTNEVGAPEQSLYPQARSIREN